MKLHLAIPIMSVILLLFITGCGDDDTRVDKSLYEIVIVKDTSQYLGTVTIMFMTGHANDPDDKDGVAGLVPRILINHDFGRNKTCLVDSLAVLNAKLEIEIGYEYTTFSLISNSDNLYSAFNLLAFSFLHPDFSNLDTKLKQITANENRTDDSALTVNVVRSVLFHGGSDDFAFSTGRELTSTDIRNFFDNYYCKDNIAIGISGNVPESLQVFMTSAFDSLKENSKKSKPDFEHTMEDSIVVLIERPSTRISHFAVGIPIEIETEDFYPTLIVALYLGGCVEGSGLISERLVFDRSISPYARGTLLPIHAGFSEHGILDMVPSENCTFIIESATTEENLEFSLKLILASIKDAVKNGIPGDDIERFKRYLLNSFLLRSACPEKRVKCLLDEILISDSLFMERFESEILKISDSAVNMALKEAFSDIRYVIAAVVKDAEQTKSDLLDGSTDVNYDSAVEEDKLRYRDLTIRERGFITEPDRIIIRQNIY